MSLIDFNGRLFGKINIIDLMIILLLILGLIFAGRLIYNLARSDEKWVVVDFKFDNIPKKVANSIELGYVEKIADKVVAEVLELQSLQSSNVFTKSILLKVKLLVNIENNVLIHKDKNLVAGAYRNLILGPHDLDYGYAYLYEGLILNIDRGSDEGEVEKIVEVGLYNQYPWISEAIKVGSKEINYQNETIAEVILKQTRPFQFVHVVDVTGEVLVRENPIRDDIILKLKLYGRLGDDGVFVFKEKRLLIGMSIALNLDKSLFLNGFVTKIE